MPRKTGRHLLAISRDRRECLGNSGHGLGEAARRGAYGREGWPCIGQRVHYAQCSGRCARGADISIQKRHASAMEAICTKGTLCLGVYFGRRQRAAQNARSLISICLHVSSFLAGPLHKETRAAQLSCQPSLRRSSIRRSSIQKRGTLRAANLGQISTNCDCAAAVAARPQSLARLAHAHWAALRSKCNSLPVAEREMETQQ